jgi:hypothetical protein
MNLDPFLGENPKPEKYIFGWTRFWVRIRRLEISLCRWYIDERQVRGKTKSLLICNSWKTGYEESICWRYK